MKSKVTLYLFLFLGAFAGLFGEAFVSSRYPKKTVHVAIGGPNAWFNSQAQGPLTPGTVYSANYAMMWSTVTLTSGTATQLRIYSNSGGGTGNVVLGLYNGAGALIAQTNPTSCVIGANGYITATLISSVAVTSGAYTVSALDDGATIGWEIDTSGPNVGRDGGQAYPALPSTLPSNNNAPGGQFTVGVFVL